MNAGLATIVVPEPVPGVSLERDAQGIHLDAGPTGRCLSDAEALMLSRELAALTLPASKPATRLTPRETEVLRHLAAGFSNKEVSRRLGLSCRTVETHRLNLRNKTATGRLKDLVALARTLGLEPVT